MRLFDAANDDVWTQETSVYGDLLVALGRRPSEVGFFFFCFLICFFGFRLVWPSVSISGGHAGGRGRCASQDPKLVPGHAPSSGRPGTLHFLPLGHHERVTLFKK